MLKSLKNFSKSEVKRGQDSDTKYLNKVRAEGGDFSKFFKRMKERSKKLSTNASSTSYMRDSPSTAN